MLTRDRRTEPFETSLTFKTVEGSPLPARMLNVFFDADDWLGAEAKVVGNAQLAAGWIDRLESRLSRRDARRRPGPAGRPAVPSPPADGKGSHRVREGCVGPATVAGKGRAGSRSRASSSAGQGSIGLDLFEALAREMKFRPSARRSHTSTLARPEVEFRSLGLSFAMQSNGEIQITGALGSRVSPGRRSRGREHAAALRAAGHGQRAQPDQDAVPRPANNSGVMIPLTTESQVLLSLPLPAGADLPGRPTLDAN